MKKIFLKIYRFFPIRMLQLVSLFLSLFFVILAGFGVHIPFLGSNMYTSLGDISLVVDVSKSMDALDIQQGGDVISRLDAVKHGIETLVSELPYGSYALSVFAGDAIRILPFTSDKDIFLTFLSGISHQDVSTQGTDLMKALQSGIDSFATEGTGGVLVLFSDGGEQTLNPSDLQVYEEQLQKKKIQFFVVGVGTSQGAGIPDGSDVFGNTVYKNYNGQPVITKLDSSNLRELASYLKGTYIEVSDYSGMNSVISSIKNAKFPSSNNEVLKGSGDTVSVTPLIFLAFIFFLLFLSFYVLPQKEYRI